MQNSSLVGGRYRLARRVGAGSMGVVFEVEDQQTGRRVALKQVLYGGKDHQQRLLREARVLQRLKHPNIIEVLDVGVTEAGTPFLVMPLLTGETLADLLKRKRRVAPLLAAQVGRDIACALAAAHAEGIIHRDLKPANVFIHRPGKAERPIIKVLDFGVCKDVNSKLTVLTSAGNVVGTPAFMSPEQLKCAELDARTDIWSLGVVLFEMLTGVRPFRGEGVELFLKILNGEIPTVSRLVRSMPPALADIVSRCLSRDREERIGSAAELASLLDDLIREGMVVSTATPVPEQEGSTSGSMATHLGSQTVSGAILAEAGASEMSLSSLAGATDTSAPGAPPRVVVATSGTPRSAPLPESEDVKEPLNGVSGEDVAVTGDRAMGNNFSVRDRGDIAPIETASHSALDAEEESLNSAPDYAGVMSLDREAFDGISPRAVLAISAATLMCALLGVGIYATFTESSKRAPALAAGLTEAPTLPAHVMQAATTSAEAQVAISPPSVSSPTDDRAPSVGPSMKSTPRVSGAPLKKNALPFASAKSAPTKKSVAGSTSVCGGTVAKRCVVFE